MNLGAEPKKVAFLAGLVVIAIGGLYWNSSGDSTPPPATRTIVPVVSTAATTRSVTKATKAQTPGQSNGGEFRPRVLGTRPDDKIDPKDIDPELKLDLLAKVQAVEPIEAGRNLFQYGAAPPPPGPPKPLPGDVPKIPIKPTVAPPPTAPIITKNEPPSTPPPHTDQSQVLRLRGVKSRWPQGSLPARWRRHHPRHGKPDHQAAV